LLTGERVEILCSDRSQPSFDWLNPDLGYTRSPTAEAKIRRWFRRRPEEERITLGCQQVRRIVERLSLDVVDFLALARHMGYPDERAFFLDVGGCRLSIADVLPELLAVYGEPQLSPAGKGRANGSIIGVGSLDSCIAPCCKPEPGDDIAGYILSPEHVVEVHRSSCPTFLESMVQDKTRLVTVRWGEVGETYLACIAIRTHDRPFFLHDVWNIIYEEGVNVADVEVKVNRARDALVTICIDIEDWIQFNRILARIEDLPGTIKVRRIEAGLRGAPRGDVPQESCCGESRTRLERERDYAVDRLCIPCQLYGREAAPVASEMAHER
jgi:GTP pyrophosphokinase